MTRRWLLALLGIALVAGAVAWVLAGLPGPPVACLPAGCDCEAAGPGPIRQPANAWSSLALAAAGIAAITWARRQALTRTVAGAALVAAGVSTFLYHAGLTAWGARLDGVTAAVLVGALALHGFSQRLPRGAQRQPSPPALSRWRGRGRVAEGRGGGRDQQNPARGGAATWARAARALAPWLLIVLGGICWWLGQNEGPWCRPDSLLQAHAVWHVLAAGAIGLWVTTEKPARTGPQVLPPSSLRAGDSDTR